MSQIKCIFSGKNTKPANVGNLDFPSDDNTVCDPLAESSAESFENGLLAKLILKTPQMSSKPASVLEYHEKGQRLEQSLYFADVNLPTQQFTKGFKTRTGEVLVDASGEKLIENFALEYTSTLKLSSKDSPGHYEIALLSDDGARLFIKEGNSYNELINNDGIHQTRMGCSFKTVYMDQTTEIPIKILYYQGSRYHMANVMMWKRHSKAQTWKDPYKHSLCGFQGNGLFFTEKSDRDTLTMKLLKADGFATVASANFKMPATQGNPCVSEDLKISEAAALRAGPTATVTWKTNVPATSQVRITNRENGEVYLSQLDSNMVTEHSVYLENMSRGAAFYLEVISVDAKGVQVIGAPPIDF